MVRGEVLHVREPRGTRGREQHGPRYAVVVQADEMLGLGTVVVAPTSRSAPPVSFRPIIDIGGTPTNVLVDQIYAADPSRFEASAGRLTASEIARVDEGLAVILGL